MGFYGKYIDQNYNDESIEEGVISDIKEKIVNLKDLKEQWKKVADSFVKHKWIYRYIDDKQKVQLEKHYAVLTQENPYYSNYKRSFQFICKFMGLPSDKVILENMVFKKDDKDKNQEIVAIKYSKGLCKVKIPEGVKLIHVSPADNIKELNPSFKSKVVGKYMYPSRRCFFTVAKDIKAKQAGLEGQKTTRYTPTQKFDTAYIDPTYSDFKSGSIYIETEKPIPVEKYNKGIKNNGNGGDK